MRQVETRIERLEREIAGRMPERVTAAWLHTQPLWRFKEIIAALPYVDLMRCREELIAEIEASDAQS